MDVGKVIYSLLTSDATFTSYVGTRLYPGFVPQDTQFPAVVYSFDNQQPSNTKDGVSTDDNPTLNIDIYHESYSSAQAIAERIRTLLDYYTGTNSGVTIDRISFASQADNSYVSEYQFTVLSQAYNVRYKR